MLPSGRKEYLMIWQFINPKTILAAMIVFVLSSLVFKTFSTGKEIGILRGEKAALTLELKQAKDRNKELATDLKIIKNDLKDWKKEVDDLQNELNAANALNDTLIARYSAFYKKTTGKELRAKELKINKRGK